MICSGVLTLLLASLQNTVDEYDEMENQFRVEPGRILFFSGKEPIHSALTMSLLRKDEACKHEEFF